MRLEDIIAGIRNIGVNVQNHADDPLIIDASITNLGRLNRELKIALAEKKEKEAEVHREKPSKEQLKIELGQEEMDLKRVTNELNAIEDKRAHIEKIGKLRREKANIEKRISVLNSKIHIAPPMNFSRKGARSSRKGARSSRKGARSSRKVRSRKVKPRKSLRGSRKVRSRKGARSSRKVRSRKVKPRKSLRGSRKVRSRKVKPRKSLRGSRKVRSRKVKPRKSLRGSRKVRSRKGARSSLKVKPVRTFYHERPGRI
jgi:hypothetical protein